MKIEVECSAPEYVKGNYEYRTLEEVFNFFGRIRGLPKGLIGHWLLVIAKDGSLVGYTARYGLRIESDFHDYELAQKVARESGLFQKWDRVSPRVDVALAFAQSFDKEAYKKKCFEPRTRSERSRNTRRSGDFEEKEELARADGQVRAYNDHVCKLGWWPGKAHRLAVFWNFIPSDAAQRKSIRARS